MLSHKQIEKVKKLLKAGKHSERAIARLTGVARTVIHRLANGKNKKWFREEHQWDDHWHGLRSPIPNQRCPKCGAKVQMPCLVCIMRELATEKHPPDKQRKDDLPVNGENLFALQLKPEQQERYEKVRKWRMAQKDPHFTEVPEHWPFRRRPPKRWRVEEEAEDCVLAGK
ncbi:MAG: hypothetical protein FWE67_16475 [Planctomycetaceae bacterium]|nr:hypothetical protein [Planctomycetaceae bacterium]